MTPITLSEEQQIFINSALERKNILVDACIGSGKTTAIQNLCDIMPTKLSILYLTYNKLLKLDAKSKIKNNNVTVTNYHGFAYKVLKEYGIEASIPDLIQTFNKNKPPIKKYDVLIIDEYQDIENELAIMLEYIKESNPDIQIIAVGDMSQKIYDKTTLNVPEFILKFLGEHIEILFTNCFRLSSNIAEILGRIWNKEIKGINDNCIVQKMTLDDTIDFLSKQEPKDILCLGSRYGTLSTTLNRLEIDFPEKFNKNTVYASISDNDTQQAISPKKTSAIFTTFDSSKGLERKICVVFDFTENYWDSRKKKPHQSYEILRNIFCVAASRGKERIIFVDNNEQMLSENTISTKYNQKNKFDNVSISEMFDFKYIEDIESCYKLLDIEKIYSDEISNIDIKSNDGLIDLSPCIGKYQEAMFFNNYNIDTDIIQYMEIHKDKNIQYNDEIKNSELERKILFLTSQETSQNRYINQVVIPFVNENQTKKIKDRLETTFSRDEIVQKKCKIDFYDKNNNFIFSALGRVDVLKDNIVYELKFVNELSHEHFLQCACYMIALSIDEGILWNTRTNYKYKITIPSRKAFLDAVAIAITKRNLEKYYFPKEITSNNKNIAVIDTETNWVNEVMSIGIVISNSENYKIIDKKYFVLDPEYKVGGMYSNVMAIDKKDITCICTRKDAIAQIKSWFNEHDIKNIYAYNASFDCNHLYELSYLEWHDIMAIAAYKQFNKKIPDYADCFKTGKLKRNYGVEPIYKMLSGNNSYQEKHNALLDALNELEIMEMLGLNIDTYNNAIISPKNKSNECIKKVKNYPINNQVSTTNINNNQIINATNDYNLNDTNYNTYSNADINYTVENNLIESNENNLRFYTANEVAEILNITQSTVYKKIEDNEIDAIRINNQYAISKKSFNYYIQKKQELEKLERLKKRRKRIIFISATSVALIIYITFMVFLFGEIL